ncbi:MAG: DUF2029 domain-containing protein [Anaerolineales bacterium]|jgi:hypothetical protein|nr:DUF2029 domain-containing protein [Anaerolineales bacterium]
MDGLGIQQLGSAAKNSDLDRWLNRAWLLLFGLFLAVIGVIYFRPENCVLLATDFRGYYATAQIILQHGFAAAYDPQLQQAYQAALPIRCLDGTLAGPALDVMVPYLPVFVLALLPWQAFDFSAAYVVWSVINLVVLALYLRFLTARLAVRPGWLRLLQWLVCLPVLANLALGQINVLWVIGLGEFACEMIAGKPGRAGLWSGLLLLKPHVLILLLPGLLAARQWRALAGFGASLSILVGASWALAGVEGLRGMFSVVSEFAGPEFLSAPAMMNWRALALNLAQVIPGRAAWGIAASGMGLTAAWVIWSWGRAGRKPFSVESFLFLVLISLAGACAVSWHSNLYMLIGLLVPLLVLDGRDRIPAGLRWLWIGGPPFLFGILSLGDPPGARSGLGIGLLVFNLCLIAWGYFTLSKK